MLRHAPAGADSSAASIEDRSDDHHRAHSSAITKKERASQRSGRLACDICRERRRSLRKSEQSTMLTLFTGKVRCDRGDPKCGRCVRLGYDCSYQGRKRHRAAQADMPRQLCELQNRLGKCPQSQIHCESIAPSLILVGCLSTCRGAPAHDSPNSIYSHYCWTDSPSCGLILAVDDAL